MKNTAAALSGSWPAKFNVIAAMVRMSSVLITRHLPHAAKLTDSVSPSGCHSRVGGGQPSGARAR